MKIRNGFNPFIKIKQVKFFIRTMLFSVVLGALTRRLEAENPGQELVVPARVSVLRGLWAAVVASLTVVMGSGFAAALQSGSLQDMYRDPAKEEYVVKKEGGGRAAALWSDTPIGLPVASSSVDACPTEEV